MSEGIAAWADREGRLWLDSGYVKDDQLIIELVNGAARGKLDWVEERFGPLVQLGGVTR